MISIIIPTCNRVQDLKLCLAELVPQVAVLGNECEIIVTDDGQKEPAETMIRKCFLEVKWQRGPCRGPAANRNAGAAVAKGDWLIFLDDDVLPGPKLLEAYISSFEQHSHISVFEGATYSNILPSEKNLEAPINLEGGTLPSCNFAIKKDLFREIGGFREVFPHWMEDVDLYKRLKCSSIDVCFVAEARVFHPARLKPSTFKLALRWRARSVFEVLWGKSRLTLLIWLPLHLYRVRSGTASRNKGLAVLECIIVAALLPFWVALDWRSIEKEKARGCIYEN